MRRLDFLLVQPAQQPESRAATPAVVHRRGDQDDASRPAFVEQFQQRVNEGPIVEHDAVGHRHLTVQADHPVTAECGERDAAATGLARVREALHLGAEPF